MFGKPFRLHEAEGRREGYIVDVAASIISYKTLYNLHCPIVRRRQEKLYSKGVVSKAAPECGVSDDGQSIQGRGDAALFERT